MKSKGFTLIELLVVVAIIGILAAVGVVAYNGYTEAAKIRAIKAQHAMIKEYIKNKMCYSFHFLPHSVETSPFVLCTL